MRQCVFGISDQVRLKPVSSTRETSYIIEILDLVRVGILLKAANKKVLIRLRVIKQVFA